MKLGLEDKVVLVTGGSRGIGRAASLLFGEAGARVAISFQKNEAAAREVVARIGADRAISIRADAGDPKATEAMIDAVAAALRTAGRTGQQRRRVRPQPLRRG